MDIDWRRRNQQEIHQIKLGPFHHQSTNRSRENRRQPSTKLPKSIANYSRTRQTIPQPVLSSGDRVQFQWMHQAREHQLRDHQPWTLALLPLQFVERATSALAALSMMKSRAVLQEKAFKMWTAPRKSKHQFKNSRSVSHQHRVNLPLQTIQATRATTRATRKTHTWLPSQREHTRSRARAWTRVRSRK